MRGLCGNYNSDMRDDFQTPSGGGIAETSALIFADSWKLQPNCPKPTEVTVSSSSFDSKIYELMEILYKLNKMILRMHSTNCVRYF